MAERRIGNLLAINGDGQMSAENWADGPGILGPSDSSPGDKERTPPGELAMLIHEMTEAE